MKLSRGDPTEAVERAFGRIQQERMAGLPLVNPALHVQAVDFQPWQDNWLGIVITPWCMSVLLVPGDAAQQLAAGVQRQFVKFPIGQLALLEGNEPELGAYRTCALFSPMQLFETQAQALATARASMVALLAPPAPASAPPPRARPAASRRRFLGLRQNPGA